VKEGDVPRLLLIAVAVVVISAAIPTEPGAEPAGSITAFVSIPPQQYVVDRIGGTHVTTEVLVAPGQSPHSFDATPKQMVALAESRVYFAIGLPFERELLARIKELHPDLEIVDMGRGVPRRKLEERAEHGTARGDPHRTSGDRAEHGPEEGHGDEAHGNTDPHIWLSPRLARIQARNVLVALVEIDPVHADDYRSNYASLLGDLNELDGEIAEALAPVRGRTIYVFHPAFGYLTDAYGLKQIAVETEGSEPSARDLARLIEEARRDGVRVIFVQPQFAPKSAAAVAREIGGAVVPIDPLAYDYLANLRTMASLIRKALAPEER
jgi:zinc transport system substrate-binding protein